jgi:hypothetical protein
MSVQIPILINHDNTRTPIGVFEDGIVTVFQPMTKNQIFAIFGNVGFLKLEFYYDDDILNTLLITKFEILEWSLENPRK